MAESRVNTYTLGDQSNASITALAGGGYVVVWQSQGEDNANNDYGVYAQRYDANGNTVGSETRINTTTAGDQTFPAVAALAGGGYAVTWTTPGMNLGDTDVHAQRYDANGGTLGTEVLINNTTANPQDVSAIAGLSGGGYVVTWTSVGDIYAQRYDANGNTAGVETRINTYTPEDQTNSAVTALAGGGYVVTWQSYNQDGSDYGIYAQRYDSNGIAAGGETHVSSATNNIQANASVTALAGGGYVVAWQSYGQDGSQEGVYFQRYNASGVTQGSETQVNTTTSSVQSMPSLASLSEGGYVVTWQSYAQDGTFYNIFSRTYDASGSPTGGETLINTVTAEQQTSPVVAGLADGGYAIAWQSYDQDGSGYGIYTARAEGSDPFTWTGTAGADSFTAPTADDWTISGLGGNDTLSGFGGRDTIDGGGGDDVLDGNGGGDTIHGGNGNDTIRDSASGLAGNNIIDGGSGVDTLDFSGFGALNLSLAITTAQAAGGSSYTYTLSGIENIIGGNDTDKLTGDAGDNVLTGNAGNDTLNGGDGNDTLNGGGFFDLLNGGAGNDVLNGGDQDDMLNGGAGDDTLNGGAGIDTAAYDDATAGVTVFLALSTGQNTGGAGNDTLIGIENLAGSAFDDTLLGDDADNQIAGGGGADSIDGGAGTNLLNGGEGNDNIWATVGINTIYGGNGLDALYGGGGTNNLNGGDGDDYIALEGNGTNTVDGGAGTDGLYISGYLRDNGLNVDLTSLWTTGSGSYNGNSYTGMEKVNGARGSDFDDYINLGGTATSADVHCGDVLDTAGGMAGNDTIIGTNGANYLSGNDGDDSLSGLGGIDHLSGGNGDDQLDGGAGNDVLTGGDGNDRLDGGTGADAMSGGAGDDTYYVDDAGDTVIEAAGEGVDTIVTSIGSYTLGDTVENLRASGDGEAGGFVLDVTFTGNALDNVITGSGYDVTSGAHGNDTLNGLAGNDTIDGLDGDDVLNGGDGNDTLFGSRDLGAFGLWLGSEADTLNGGGGNDVLDGGIGNDRLDGGAGNDVLNGGDGRDTIDGGAGVADIATYEDAARSVTVSLMLQGVAQNTRGGGVDLLRGIEGLTGSNFNDTLTGSDGADRLDGGGGRDIIHGGSGDDTIDGGAANDTLDGEAGFDCATYGDAASGVTVSLALQGTAQNTIAAGRDILSGFEALTGSAFGDTLTGDINDNRLTGGAGDDVLNGGGGKDQIDGGSGKDVIIGGAGQDTLTGGNSADQFRFFAGDTTDKIPTADLITDFSQAQHDRIDLKAIDAIEGTAHVDRFTFVGASAFSGAAGELRYRFSGGETIVAGDTDGDKTADLFIRLTGNIALTSADFLPVPFSSALGGGNAIEEHGLAAFHTAPLADLSHIACLV